MLAAPNRLRSRRDITRTAKRGRFAVEGAIAVKVAPNHLAASRAVVVVGKRVSKKAVVRNRLRRQIAAALASQWATVAPGYDMIVTVRDDVSAAAASELNRQLAALLERAKVKNSSTKR